MIRTPLKPRSCFSFSYFDTRFALRQKAFTLIEVLVVTSIVSLLAIGLYSAFHTGLLSYKKIDATSHLYQSGRITFKRLENDLANVVRWYPEDSRFIGQPSGLEFFCVSDMYYKGTVVGVPAYIKYEVIDNSLQYTRLRGLEALTHNTGSVPQNLCDNVKELSFEYVAESADKTLPYEWQKAWPRGDSDGQKETLPLAVKVRLVLAEYNNKGAEETVEFSTIIPLASGNR